MRRQRALENPGYDNWKLRGPDESPSLLEGMENCTSAAVKHSADALRAEDGDLEIDWNVQETDAGEIHSELVITVSLLGKIDLDDLALQAGTLRQAAKAVEDEIRHRIERGS